MGKSVEICLPGDESNIDPIDLLSLPFKSTYKILGWTGLANPANLLAASFNINDVRGRYVVIKSFQMIPYYAADAVDLFVTDGVTTNQETIPSQGRIDRIFDRFGFGTTIDLRINDAPVSFFNADLSFPLDVDLQNIYYKFPQKVDTITLRVLSSIIIDIVNDTAANPLVKVIMEVYLL